jgi:hypothetical protein
MHRRKHEHRLIAILQAVLGPGALESEVSVPRASCSIDARIVVEEPTDLWGPLAPLVAHRTVVIEHESRGPTRAKLHTAVAKVCWIAVDEQKHIRAPRRRPPLLLFLSADCPRWIASGGHGFGLGPLPGVYRMDWQLGPELVLVHLRGLPGAPGLSLLKLLPTPRDQTEAAAGMQRLKEDLAVLQSTKARVQEAIMTHQIPATSNERWITAEEVRHEAQENLRRELARKALARGLSVTEVAELTELTEEQVRELAH